MDKTLNVRIQNAYKTETEWNTQNPVAKEGEIMFSSDKRMFKVGDGVSNWKTLTYNSSLTLNGLTASVAELNYVKGVTSNIQTQLDGKAASSHKHSAGDITSGTLAVGRGGTGQTTLNAAANSLINSLSEGSTTPTDNDYYVAQYAGGGTTTTTYLRRPVKALWSYIKSKTDTLYALVSHTHNYAGSSSAGGSATSAVKLDSSAGSATQPIYFSGGKPVATTYALHKTVPADAKFTDTNTWRGIQDNLTSTSTTDSLSANQGKILKGLVDGKLPLSGGTLSGDLSFSHSNGNVTWASGSYYQRIHTIDDSIADTNIFEFQQSTDSGSNWTTQMAIKDNGKVVANTFVGTLSGNATSASKVIDCNDSRELTFSYGKAGLSTASWFAAWNGNELRAISSANVLSAIGALKKTGDVLTTASQQYNGNYGINMSNSDIIGINGMWTSDLAETCNEGLNFYRTNGNYDGVWSKDGIFYYTPNHVKDGTATDYTVLHSGNYNDYSPTKTGTGASGTWGINISGSAAKLTTARTINGTSFNGSANITTSNWGTSRTLTIGSTGKSVNGSGNVSWSLSEIGVAASGHTHNYAGSSSAGGAANSAYKLNIFATRPTSANVIIAGDGSVRHYLSSSSMTTNKPPVGDGNILHFEWDNTGGYSKQLALSHGSAAHMAIRGMAAGTWGDWLTVLDSNNYSSYALPLSGGTVSGDVTLGRVLFFQTDYYPGNILAKNAANVRRYEIYTGSTDGAAADVLMRVYNTDASGYAIYRFGLNGSLTANTFVGALSGNATTASNLSNFKNTNNSATAVDSFITNGIGYVNGISGIFGRSDGAIYAQRYNDSWIAQIYQDYRTGQIALRGKNNGTWQSWRKVLDSGNYTSYPVKNPYSLTINTIALGGGASGIMYDGSSAMTLDLNFNHTHSGLFNVKYFGSNYQTAFRTTFQGHSGHGDFLSIIRPSETGMMNAPSYSSGVTWGVGDTQGYLITAYYDPVVYIGGGNSDKLNWVKQISFTDHTHNYAGSSSVGGAANSATLINPNKGVSTVSTSVSGWNGALPSGHKIIWAQSFVDSALGTDTGDIGISLSGSTTANIFIDGNYYSMGNIVLNAGNYSSYALPLSGGTVSGQFAATRIGSGYMPTVDNSIGCSNWFRSSGNSGWYNESYAGGIFMQDTTWVRVYNNKYFHTGGVIRAGNEIQSEGANQFRAAFDQYGFIIRNDGVNTYFLLTNAGDKYGTWRSVFPFMLENSTGKITMNGFVVPVTTETGSVACRPTADNSKRCGSSSYRFSYIHAASGTIQTSDEREKNILGNLSAYEKLFMKLSPIAYRWKDNDDKRIRFGLGAQTTEREMIACGLNVSDYSMIDHDYFDEPVSGLMDRYGMNYQELDILTMHMTQQCVRKVVEHEDRLTKAEQRAESLQYQLNQAFERIAEQDKQIKQLQSVA